MDASGAQIRSDPSEYVNIIEDSITGPGKYMDNHVLWEIDKIEAGKSETFSFKVTVKEDLGGEELITNKSILEYRGSVIEKSVEEKLSLFSDLTASEAFIYDANGGELYPGETINARVIVRNTGEKKEENYRVICPIPPAATYISRTGTAEGITWSDEIRGLIWELRDLGAGEEKEITLSMKANENLAGSGGTVTINFKIESSNGTVEMPPKSLNVRGSAALNILVMGDSLIVKSNWVQAFDGLLEANYPHAEYNTVASAVSGEMARGGNARIDSNIAEHNPGIIIIAYGTNDVGPRASGFTGNMESMFIKAKNSGARVFVNLIGPIHGWPGKEGYARYNDAIRQIAARHGVVVIDVLTPLSQNPGGYLSDGMHYTSAGASVVAHTVFSYVSQYLGTIGQRL
jgi:lysophospholipase L1-like esterase